MEISAMSKNKRNPKKMIISRVYLLLLMFVMSCASAPVKFTTAQNSDNLNQGSIKQESYFQKIPYQNIDGWLIVPVSINGKTYNFCFDTGAPLTISDKILRELNLPIIRQEKIEDLSGRREEMRVILLPELHLHGITFIDTPGLVFNEESSESVDHLECYGIDGFIGSNMLRNSAVQIDEQSKHIIITNNVGRLSIEKKIYQYMELDPDQSCPFIKIRFHKGEQVLYDRKVVFDTGAAGSFYRMKIDSYNWCNDNDCAGLINKITESEGSFALSAHGTNEKQQHLLLNIPKLNINGTIFNNVVTYTTNGSTSIIGSKLLEYGKVTLDFINKRFYFEAFDNIKTDDLSKRPWAIGPTWRNGKLVVGIIWDKKLESQINLGDEVLSINGIDISSMSLCEYENRPSPNKTSSNEEQILELRDIKTGKIKPITIKRL